MGYTLAVNIDFFNFVLLKTTCCEVKNMMIQIRI